MTVMTNSVISIVGPTAVGKTKLSIELALALCTEVISLDSLQCYKPGSIATAKVTVAEAKGVRHHLVDYLNAEEEPASFITDGVKCVQMLQKRGKVPIIAGGSTSLTVPLLKALKELGNQIFVVILMVPSAAHQHFIEARVDKMVQDGLLEEMVQLYGLEQIHLDGQPNFARGVWKTIGYKELRPYIMSKSEGHDKEILADAISQIKLNSVIYAQEQYRWIRGDLFPFLNQRRIPHTEMKIAGKDDLEIAVRAALRACVGFLLRAEPNIGAFLQRN